MSVDPLSLIFGTLVGLSLGLTGGGGAIFAVPLLVYGLQLPPREAVGISLAAVGTAALVGVIRAFKQGMVEVPTGLLFSVAGMAGTPAGAWISRQLPENALLFAFAGLMLFVAVRMWRKATPPMPRLWDAMPDDDCGPTCRRDPVGVLRWTSRCAMLLMFVGLGTGILAGLFGVGGGFVIVPALVAFTGMGMRRAIGTSLLAIALVSAAGVTSHIFAGGGLSWWVAMPFAAGGAAGVLIGQSIAKRLSGPVLQKTFSTAIVLVAAFVITKSLTA